MKDTIKYNYVYNNQIIISEECLYKNQYTWAPQYNNIVVGTTEFFCNLIQDNYDVLDIGVDYSRIKF